MWLKKIGIEYHLCRLGMSWKLDDSRWRLDKSHRKIERKISQVQKKKVIQWRSQNPFICMHSIAQPSDQHRIYPNRTLVQTLKPMGWKSGYLNFKSTARMESCLICALVASCLCSCTILHHYTLNVHETRVLGNDKSQPLPYFGSQHECQISGKGLIYFIGSIS